MLCIIMMMMMMMKRVHRHKISNALNTLVLRQKECLQHLFEGRICRKRAFSVHSAANERNLQTTT